MDIVRAELHRSVCLHIEVDKQIDTSIFLSQKNMSTHFTGQYLKIKALKIIFGKYPYQEKNIYIYINLFIYLFILTDDAVPLTGMIIRTQAEIPQLHVLVPVDIDIVTWENMGISVKKKKAISEINDIYT